MQTGAADPNAAAGQAAQGQWPSDYYSNYWGGEYFVSSFNKVLICSRQGTMDNKPLVNRARQMVSIKALLNFVLVFLSIFGRCIHCQFVFRLSVLV